MNNRESITIWTTLVLVWVCSCTASPTEQTAAEATARSGLHTTAAAYSRRGTARAASSLHVCVIVDELLCLRTTDKNHGLLADDRDEIYFKANGNRVPKSADEEEPIYEVGENELSRGWGWWRRKGEALPAPTLWEGELTEDESRIINISMWEQDNGFHNGADEQLTNLDLTIKHEPGAHAISCAWTIDGNQWCTAPNTPRLTAKHQRGEYAVSFTILVTDIRPQLSSADAFEDWIPPGRRLERVYLRHSAAGLHALCSTWIGTDGHFRQRGQFRGNQEAGDPVEIQLAESEVVTQMITYREGNGIIRGLVIETNRQRYPSTACYGRPIGTPTIHRPSEGKTVLGFKGRYGADIDSLALVERVHLALRSRDCGR
jgi:hypothetical protein